MKPSKNIKIFTYNKLCDIIVTHGAAWFRRKLWSLDGKS